MKRFKNKLFLFLFLLVFSLFNLGFVNPQTASATETAEDDLVRRKLYSLAECLSDAHLQTSRDANSVEEFFHPFHYEPVPTVVVGIDRTTSGMMTCRAAMFQGIEVYDETATDANLQLKVLIKKLTGQDNITGPISANTLKTNRNKWIAELNTQIQSLGAPNVPLTLSRFAGLVQACYDIDTISTSTPKPEDWDATLHGQRYFFKYKAKIETVEALSWIKKLDEAGGKDNYYLGMSPSDQVDLPGIPDDLRKPTLQLLLILLDFHTQNFNWERHFYPVGGDLNVYPSHQPLLASQLRNSIVDCQFVWEHKGTNDILKSDAVLSIDTATDKITYGMDTDGDGKADTDLGGESTTDKGGIGTASGSDRPSCESTGVSLAWIFCPVINGIAIAADGMYNNLIKPLLKTPIIDAGNPNDPSVAIWSGFRIFGNIVLIFGLLALVFSQVIGGGLIDAYSVKKIAPRILTAVILLNLSIYIVAVLNDLANVLGDSIGKLITAPIQGTGHYQLTISGTTGGLGIAALITGAGGIFAVILSGGLASLMMFGLVFILLPAILAFIGVLATVLIRRGLILFLIIVSPIAFALYCLPATEKYFKKWWSLLFKTLMVYPIIAIVFAIADVMSVLISQPGSGIATPFANFISIVLLVLPMFLIPFTFKLAGGAIATLYGAISGASNKTRQAILGRENDPNSLRNRARLRGRSAYNQARGNVVDNLNRRYTRRGQRLLVDKAGNPILDADGNQQYRPARVLSPGDQRARSLSTLGARILGYGNLEYERSRMNKEEAERVATQQSFGGDASIRSIFAYERDGRYFSYVDGKEVPKAQALKAKQNVMGNISAFQEALSYEMTKASQDGNYGKLLQRYEDMANEQNWSAFDAQSIWIGSAFKNKGVRLEQKHRKIAGEKGNLQFGDVNHLTFAEEFGTKTRAYEAGGFQPSTFGAMDAAMAGALAAGGGSTASLAANSDELRTLQYLYHGITNLESPISGGTPAAGGAPAGVGATVLSFGASGVTAAAAERSAAAIKALAVSDPRIAQIPVEAGTHNPTPY